MDRVQESQTGFPVKAQGRAEGATLGRFVRRLSQPGTGCGSVEILIGARLGCGLVVLGAAALSQNRLTRIGDPRPRLPGLESCNVTSLRFTLGQCLKLVPAGRGFV